MAKKQATTDTTRVDSSTADAGSFEDRTGVDKKELQAKADTTPLIRKEPSTSFSERTSAVQPWAEYQEAANKAEAENAKEEAKNLQASLDQAKDEE